MTSAARGLCAFWNRTIRSCVAGGGSGMPEHAVQQAAEVRLVERAGVRDEIAEVTHGALAEAGEAVGRARAPPSRRRVAIQRGEVKWWNVSIGVSPCSWHASSTRR